MTAEELRADCASCFGLCCVAPSFAASADFAIDKRAGEPCPHLRPDFGCGIHDQLRPRGFPGCAVYDCFGAGQKVAQHTYGGRDWRTHPATASQMYAVFAVMRQLHELRWYLAEALALRPDDELRRALDETVRLGASAPEAVLAVDMAGHHQRVNALLLRTSEAVRAPDGQRVADRRGADLVGADLREADLRRASLRGALLIRADLTGACLDLADLTGADLRGAELGGADLAGALFVTQSQLDAAAGDTATRIPARLARPAHWRVEST